MGMGLWISLELPEHLWLFASLFYLYLVSVRIVMKTSKEVHGKVKLGEGPSVPSRIPVSSVPRSVWRCTPSALFPHSRSCPGTLLALNPSFWEGRSTPRVFRF